MADTPSTSSPTAAPQVVVQQLGAVRLITMNRPEVRNAMTPTMATAIGTALDEAEGDAAIGAVVITGAGSAFCAGGDLAAIRRGEGIHSHEHPEWGFGGMRHHFIDKPVLAAVNGPALGGGFEMCLAADLAIAAEEAEFALPEVLNGLPPNAGGAYRLMHQLPRKLALELVLSGRRIDARTAASWGLVNEVVPGAELVERAVAFAARLAALPAATMRATKRMAYGISGGVVRDEATRWLDHA